MNTISNPSPNFIHGHPLAKLTLIAAGFVLGLAAASFSGLDVSLSDDRASQPSTYEDWHGNVRRSAPRP